MEGYLGEIEVDWKTVPEFSKFKRTDWALLYISSYGGYDGAHHKDWVLDQVVRILNGSKIKLKKATWDNGHFEYRYSVGKSKKYTKWVDDVIRDEDGEINYDYELGIAP